MSPTKLLFRFLCLSVCIGCFCPSAAARDFYVHPVDGLETNDGLAAENESPGHGPFKTIHRGLRTAQPGDTVHLAPLEEPYHESPVFHDRLCPADKPITLDGHGATITGAERIDLSEWELVAPGRYRKVKLLAMNPAVLGRWFFRINGQMQHMGRTSKGTSAPLKKPDDLEEGEWTYVEADDAFYVQLDPDTPRIEYVIEAPMRSAGVQISGRNENIVVRNLNTQHVYNDGFNIHGYSRGVLLENVSAVECGDDGISAHDDCRIRVEGFTSIGNSTGFCHTNDSESDSNRVLIRDCLGFDVFVLDTGRHTLTNSIVYSSALNSVVVVGEKARQGEANPPGECSLTIENTAIVRRGKNEFAKFQAGSIVEIRRSVLAGFHVQAAAASLELTDSIVAGGKYADRQFTIFPTTKFVGRGNLYDMTFTHAVDEAGRRAAVKFHEPFNGSIDEPNDYEGGVDPTKLPRP